MLRAIASTFLSCTTVMMSSTGRFGPRYRFCQPIEAALTVAETGHLAFATLHTNSAVQTINRIVDVFPAYQQAQVRAQLSFVLEGVMCQSLLPRANGPGRAMALEVMVPNAAIRNLIREDKIHRNHAADSTVSRSPLDSGSPETSGADEE